VTPDSRGYARNIKRCDHRPVATMPHRGEARTSKEAKWSGRIARL
jgi:hypothetical protein